MPVWLELLLALGAAVVTGAITLFFAHSAAKKREGAAEASAQDHKRQTEAQWRQIQTQETELAQAKTDLAVLKAMIAGMPSESTIRGYLESLESKLEARLNTLASSIGTQIETLLERDRAVCHRVDCPIHSTEGRR